MNTKLLIGTWSLVSFKIYCDSENTIIYPYTEKPIGCLIYTPNNYVSVHIMASNRNICASDSYRELNIDEKTEIADNYGGYFGKYRILDDTIIHYPEISSFTGFINTPQIRHFQLQKDKLILTCPYNGQRFNGMSELIWRRLL